MLNSASASISEIYPRTGALRQRILLQREKQREIELYPRSFKMRRRIDSEKEGIRKRHVELIARNGGNKTDETWEYSEWSYCPAYESVLNKLDARTGKPSFSQQFISLTSDIKDPIVIDVWKTILGQERRPFNYVGAKPDYFQILPYNGLGRKS